MFALPHIIKSKLTRYFILVFCTILPVIYSIYDFIMYSPEIIVVMIVLKLTKVAAVELHSYVFFFTFVTSEFHGIGVHHLYFVISNIASFSLNHICEQIYNFQLHGEQTFHH